MLKVHRIESSFCSKACKTSSKHNLVLFAPYYNFDTVKSIGLRGGSRNAATSKMEHFVIIVNGWKPLPIIIKCFILDVAAVVDPLGITL